MPHGTSRIHASSSFISNPTNFRLSTAALAFALTLALFVPAHAQKMKRRPPAGGRVAIVVDERLAALRDAPELSANLLQRLSRGRFVAVEGERSSRAGVTFYRVAVTR